MTFEEAQQIIQQMLASQARFDKNQTRFDENQTRFDERQARFEENQLRFEERHAAFDREIERMLAVQRDLQEGQLRLHDDHHKHKEAIERMLTVQRDLQEGQLAQLGAIEKLLIASERQERIMNQLIGYSITNESDHLDLEEKIKALGAKVKRIEQQDL